MRILFPFDLRSSLDLKVNYATSFSRKGSAWTAYINNAGTLCHMVCPQADILIRIRFYEPVKTMTQQQMHNLIKARTDRFLRV